MTKTEYTKNVLSTLPVGTILSKQDYREIYFKEYRKDKKSVCTTWDNIIASPARFGVERVEEYYTTTTSKVSVEDVLQMMRAGYTLEQIEEKVYTQVKVIKIKKIA